MNPLRDLGTRARLCAGCHVGGAAGDVNHDLIAAGHPRLNFEFLSYLDAMPAHWDAAAERRAPPGFEARAWADGQRASAHEALGLLASRARIAGARSNDTRPPTSRGSTWPEFAEYACASCHHELRPGSLRPDPAGTQPGTPAWGTWYFTMIGGLGKTEDDSKAAPEADVLARLRRVMEDPQPSAPDAERIALEARSRLDRIDGPVGPAQVHAWLARAVEVPAGSVRPGWDRDAQVVLALDALGRALGSLGEPPRGAMEGALNDLRREIEQRRSGGLSEPAQPRSTRRFAEALERYRRALAAPSSAPSR